MHESKCHRSSRRTSLDLDSISSARLRRRLLPAGLASPPECPTKVLRLGYPVTIPVNRACNTRVRLGRLGDAGLERDCPTPSAIASDWPQSPWWKDRRPGPPQENRDRCPSQGRCRTAAEAYGIAKNANHDLPRPRPSRGEY